MSSMLLDQIYIKTVQKIIKRKLSNKEIDSARSEEPIFAQNPTGMWFSFRIPLVRFPDDLMEKTVDLYAINHETENESIWNYVNDIEVNSND